MDLTYTAKEFLNFRETGIVGPWIDVLKFDVVGAATDDRSLLKALRSNPWYDHTYAEPRGDGPKESIGLHGPYLIDRFSEDDYRRSTYSRALRDVLSWAAQWEELSKPFSDRLEAILTEAFSDDCVVYELPNVRESAQHDWGWVVGLDGFHEFVSISKARSSLIVLVASDD